MLVTMERVFVVILFCVLTSVTFSQKITNLTDQLLCKLTHKGLSFVGPVSKSESGIRCQYWASPTPMHKVADSVTDAGFPENSKQKAKNYCRNPTDLVRGPWCYTLDPKVSDDSCGIPLCRYTYCRTTGPGIEYAGEQKKSASGEECLKWTKKRKTKHDKQKFRFPNRYFPGGYRSTAKRSCRNPDGNTAGPWCYVEKTSKEFDDEIVKELCDLPFCQEPDCMLYTASTPGIVEYSHFTRINARGNNITLTLKLWDPDDWRTAKVYLLLSVMATPGGPIRNLELLLGNTVTGATTGTITPEVNPSHMIISGNYWTTFSITWNDGIIVINRETSSRPLYRGEYTEKSTEREVEEEELPNTGPFRYYSIIGDSVFWSLPFCLKDCEEHVTSATSFSRFWHLKSTPTSREVNVHIRSRHGAVIELRASPKAMYPQVWIVLKGDKNMTSVIWREVEGYGVTLKEVRTEAILLYWEWREFTVSIFGNRLQLLWMRESGMQTVLEVEDDRVRPFNWFGVGSKESVTHWTLFCKPTDFEIVSLSLPPECVTFPLEDYRGTQWSSHTGRPCIPWVDSHSSFQNDMFIEKSRWAARNFCRNPLKDPDGPFCFVLNAKNEIVKEYCRIRKCRSAECRMAGTGNDYIGTLSKTRSNRNCQQWTSDDPHKVDKVYLDDDLFPDKKVADASNYCRNPSRNIMGSWCYTTDVLTEFDGCEVKDCTKPEGCTVITRGTAEGRHIYILPAWRGYGLKFWLKNWDPDKLDGIAFTLQPMDRKQFYRLVIGADNFERVKMYYSSGSGEPKMLKQKTLPRLIPIGKWGGFWLSAQEGKVEFGLEGVDSSLFEWSTDKPDEIFLPMFLSYISLAGNAVGVNFLCHECHIERTTTIEYDKILPINIWIPDHLGPHLELTLYIRGTGSAVIPLMKLPGRNDFYGLVIGKDNNSIHFVRQTEEKAIPLKKEIKTFRLIEENKWTKFYMTFNETELTVFRNGEKLLNYKSTKEAMIFYWFSVGAEEGTVIWSANCEPPGIDGRPRDGGWSDWGPYACSVTCGGGVGKQTRTCTDPEPNIYGRLCNGSDTSEGTCNTFECGEMSPDTTEMLVNQLQSKHYSYEVKQGERVTIDMVDIAAFDRIRRESPKATWEWTKNGAQINDTRDIHNGTILLTKVLPADSGVYACILHRVNKQRMILKLVALAVMPSTPTLSTRITLSATLLCNNLVLGYIYSDLSQVWLLNGKLWKDYGITTLEAVNVETIPKVRKSHEGVWKCVVSQADLGFSWVTNIVQVEVKRAPSMLSYLMEDETTAPLFKFFGTEKLVGAFLVFVLVLTIAIAVMIVFVYSRWCTLPEVNLDLPTRTPTAKMTSKPKRRAQMSPASSETSFSDTVPQETPLLRNSTRPQVQISPSSSETSFSNTVPQEKPLLRKTTKRPSSHAMSEQSNSEEMTSPAENTSDQNYSSENISSEDFHQNPQAPTQNVPTEKLTHNFPTPDTHELTIPTLPKHPTKNAPKPVGQPLKRSTVQDNPRYFDPSEHFLFPNSYSESDFTEDSLTQNPPTHKLHSQDSPIQAPIGTLKEPVQKSKTKTVPTHRPTQLTTNALTPTVTKTIPSQTPATEEASAVTLPKAIAPPKQAPSRQFISQLTAAQDASTEKTLSYPEHPHKAVEQNKPSETPAQGRPAPLVPKRKARTQIPLSQTEPSLDLSAQKDPSHVAPSPKALKPEVPSPKVPNREVSGHMAHKREVSSHKNSKNEYSPLKVSSQEDAVHNTPKQDDIVQIAHKQKDREYNSRAHHDIADKTSNEGPEHKPLQQNLEPNAHKQVMPTEPKPNKQDTNSKHKALAQEKAKQKLPTQETLSQKKSNLKRPAPKSPVQENRANKTRGLEDTGPVKKDTVQKDPVPEDSLPKGGMTSTEVSNQEIPVPKMAKQAVTDPKSRKQKVPNRNSNKSEVLAREVSSHEVALHKSPKQNDVVKIAHKQKDRSHKGPKHHDIESKTSKPDTNSKQKPLEHEEAKGILPTQEKLSVKKSSLKRPATKSPVLENRAKKSPLMKDPVPQGPVHKDIVPEDPVPEDPVPKGPVPKSRVPKSHVKKDRAKKTPTLKDSEPKDPVHKDIVPEGPVSRSTVPKDHVPKSPVPKSPVKKDRAKKIPSLKDPVPQGPVQKGPVGLPGGPVPKNPVPKSRVPKSSVKQDRENKTPSLKDLVSEAPVQKGPKPKSPVPKSPLKKDRTNKSKKHDSSALPSTSQKDPSQSSTTKKNPTQNDSAQKSPKSKSESTTLKTHPKKSPNQKPSKTTPTQKSPKPKSPKPKSPKKG